MYRKRLDFTGHEDAAHRLMAHPLLSGRHDDEKHMIAWRWLVLNAVPETVASHCLDAGYTSPLVARCDGMLPAKRA